MGVVIDIICIGNELLIGKIANTNAQWLARRATSLGSYVRRINVVRDDLVEIGSALRESLSREPSFIITTGGLGPTFDDMTLEAISKTLNLEMSVDKEALKIVEYRQHQKAFSMETEIHLNPARIKMVTLPKGATPLRNPIGTAPGVLLVIKKSTIITLPGVPKEMEAIFEDSVQPLIKQSVGETYFCERSLNVTGIVESKMAPLINITMLNNPHVYIKSHPKISKPYSFIELHLTTSSESERQGKKRIEEAVKSISKLILENCGKIQDLMP